MNTNAAQKRRNLPAATSEAAAEAGAASGTQQEHSKVSRDFGLRFPDGEQTDRTTTDDPSAKGQWPRPARPHRDTPGIWNRGSTGAFR